MQILRRRLLATPLLLTGCSLPQVVKDEIAASERSLAVADAQSLPVETHPPTSNPPTRPWLSLGGLARAWPGSRWPLLRFVD